MPRNATISTLPAKSWVVALSVAAWFGLVAAGGSVLLTYQNTPGPVAAAPAAWPGASPVRLAPETATLLMFAHPRCPCTRASIEELNRLAARAPGRFEAHVLFYSPLDRDRRWVETDLWTGAAAIPGVEVLRDSDGRTARLFGSQTSGQAVLYDRDGKLIFQGGITASRGHAGDNVGRGKILALLDERSVIDPTTPVFGCPLLGPRPCDNGGCSTSNTPPQS